MKSRKSSISLLRIVGFIAAIAVLVSCEERSVIISPPAWIQGRWEGYMSEEEGGWRIIWEFTEDNAIYECHDPAGSIDSLVNLKVDFAGRWVRDYKNEDNQYQYILRIELQDEHVFQQNTGESGEVIDPLVLQYRTTGPFGGDDIDLQKL